MRLKKHIQKINFVTPRGINLLEPQAMKQISWNRDCTGIFRWQSVPTIL